MQTAKKIARILLIVIAILVIILSLGGIVGTWYVNSIATDVTLKAFTVVDTGVNIAETGVSRVNGLVMDGRTEVQNAEETILTVSGNLQENSPALKALNTRLETRLAPTVNKIDTALQPVREGLFVINGVLDVLNSVPSIQESAPNLAKLTEVFSELEQLSADIQQLDGTLAEAIVQEKNALTDEVVTVMTDLTTRIDKGLAEIQAEVEALLAEINVLQEEITALRSRLLLIYNLSALAITLLFLWLIYSQYVVIRHQWTLFKRPADPALPAPAASDAAPAILPNPTDVLDPAPADPVPAESDTPSADTSA